jgi:hypothetical protein
MHGWDGRMHGWDGGMHGWDGRMHGWDGRMHGWDSRMHGWEQQKHMLPRWLPSDTIVPGSGGGIAVAYVGKEQIVPGSGGGIRGGGRGGDIRGGGSGGGIRGGGAVVVAYAGEEQIVFSGEDDANPKTGKMAKGKPQQRGKANRKRGTHGSSALRPRSYPTARLERGATETIRVFRIPGYPINYAKKLPGSLTLQRTLTLKRNSVKTQHGASSLQDQPRLRSRTPPLATLLRLPAGSSSLC